MITELKQRKFVLPRAYQQRTTHDGKVYIYLSHLSIDVNELFAKSVNPSVFTSEAEIVHTITSNLHKTIRNIEAAHNNNVGKIFTDYIYRLNGGYGYGDDEKSQLEVIGVRPENEKEIKAHKTRSAAAKKARKTASEKKEKEERMLLAKLQEKYKGKNDNNS